MEGTRKRNRLSLSCTNCKKRKVKCDRGTPCSSCAKYNVSDQCVYPAFNDASASDISSSTRQPSFMVQGFVPSVPSSGASGSLKSALHPNMKVVSATESSSGAKKPRNGSDGNGHANKAENAVMASELEVLKRKIKELESSLHSKDKGRSESLSTPETRSFCPYSPPKAYDLQNFAYNKPLNSPNTASAFSAVNNGASGPSSGSGVSSGSMVLPPLSNMQASPFSQSTASLSPFNLSTWGPLHVLQPASQNCPYTQINLQTKAKYITKNLYGDPNEIISFSDTHCTIRSNQITYRQSFGVFTWLAFVIRDKALRLLWDDFQKKGNYNMSSFGFMTECPDGKKNKEEAGFRKRAAVLDTSQYTRKVAPKTHPEDDKIDTPRTSENLGPIKFVEGGNRGDFTGRVNDEAYYLGFVLESHLDDTLELSEKILKVLPPKKVIWLLVNEFFNHVYPFMPFIDELDFKRELTRLIGPQDMVMEQVGKLNLDTRLDYARMGLLLVVLRFAFLSLFSNVKEVNEANIHTTSESREALDLKLLLSTPISIQVITVAQLCVDQFNVLKKNTLPVLQLMYLLRLYHMFGPEEGESVGGGESSQVTNSMLVQSAYQMGLHREPESYNDDWEDRTNNLLRKLWFFFVITDLIQGYQNGTPVAVNPKHFDTRLPFYKKGNENILDVEMEKDVVSTFAYFDKYYSRLTAILDATLDLRRQNKIKDITDMMSSFEAFFSDMFGNLQDYMVPFQKDLFKYPFTKVMKCKNYLNMNGFIISMCQQVQVHYEKQGNAKLLGYYIKKIVCLGTLNFVPCLDDLFAKKHQHFGKSADLILNPTVIVSMHKASQYNLSILTRANSVVYRYKQSPTHTANMSDMDYSTRFRKYCKLSKSIEGVSKYIIKSLTKWSSRYYYAWRVTKAHTFILNTVSSQTTFEDQDYSEVAELFMQIPMEDVDELISMYDGVLTQVSSTKKDQTVSAFASPRDASPEQPALEPDNTSSSSKTDNEFDNIVNNKEVDDIWMQMANDFGKDEFSFLQEVNDEQTTGNPAGWAFSMFYEPNESYDAVP